MKWFFIILLVVNLAYLGWELDRQTRMDLAHAGEKLVVPPHVKKLVLLKELPVPPARRGQQAQTMPAQIAGDGNKPGPETVQEAAPPPADVSVGNTFAQDLLARLPDIQAGGGKGSTKVPQDMCFSYGPFPDSGQARELMTWFEERQVAVQQRPEKDKEKQLFWIYLAPASPDHARKALEDLKRKGVKDYRLIETGDLRNAISLGLFSTQALVNRRLNELKNKGYRPIVVPYRAANIIYWVDVKLQKQKNVLNQMFTGQPAHYNSVPVACSEIAMTRVTP